MEHFKSYSPKQLNSIITFAMMPLVLSVRNITASHFACDNFQMTETCNDKTDMWMRLYEAA